MDIGVLLIPLALILFLILLGFLLWAIRDGQFEDLENKKFRIFFDEKINRRK